MRKLLKVLSWASLGLLGLSFVVLVMAVDLRPRVPPRDDVSPADIDRAVATLRQHDRRAAGPGQAKNSRCRNVTC